MDEGLLMVVSGPSGVGKGTVCRDLLRKNPELRLSVSMTTRSPRRGEEEGKSYFFTDRGTFNKLKEEGSFLEWAEVFGDYYGTPRNYLEEQRLLGRDVLLEIDTQGARQIKTAYPKGVFIFLLPPSLMELEARIMKRGTESPDAMAKRLNFALEEMKALDIYDYVVTNDRVEEAARRITAIRVAEKCAAGRNEALINKLLKEGTW